MPYRSGTVSDGQIRSGNERQVLSKTVHLGEYESSVVPLVKAGSLDRSCRTSVVCDSDPELPFMYVIHFILMESTRTTYSPILCTVTASGNSLLNRRKR